MTLSYNAVYQTQGRVFHPISKHWEVVLKNEAQPSFFDQLQDENDVFFSNGTGKLGKRISECSYQGSNLRPSDY